MKPEPHTHSVSHLDRHSFNIFCDFAVNRGRPHIQLFLVLYRAAHGARLGPAPVKLTLGVPFALIYRMYGLFVCGIDIPSRTRIGAGLTIHHGFGLVVTADAVIGSNVSLRQCTTIGSKDKPSSSPVIGDNVAIGPNSSIVGPYRIGPGAVIGVGSVVTKDVAPGSVVAGNPARVLRELAGEV